MSTPINLNKVRKSRAQSEKRKRADENAVKFGRTKAEKQRDRLDVQTQTKKLNAHKRET